MVGNPGSVFARRSTDVEEASRIGKAVFHVRHGFPGTNLGGRGLEIHRPYVIGRYCHNT